MQQPVVSPVSESAGVLAVDTVQAPPVEPPRVEPRAQAFVAEPADAEAAVVPVSTAPVVERAPEPSVATAAVAPAPVEIPAPVEAATPLPVAPAPVVPAPAKPADPKALLSGAGLEMVETDPTRAKSYQLEEAPVQLGRPRRQRPAPAAPEALMQVETKS